MDYALDLNYEYGGVSKWQLLFRRKFSFSPTVSIFNFQLTCKAYIYCRLCLFYFLIWPTVMMIVSIIRNPIELLFSRWSNCVLYRYLTIQLFKLKILYLFLSKVVLYKVLLRYSTTLYLMLYFNISNYLFFLSAMIEDVQYAVCV